MTSQSRQRACLYARYSTDKQKETSVDDQLRAARDRAEREGWQVISVHADQGISGSTPLALRRGGKALLADALAQRFEVLILEGLDRLSRELGEAESVVKRLEHRGIRIIGTADGYDTEARGRKVMRIARGLVNELYLDDLREKTHRGLAGQFDRGFSAGGKSYGYRTEAVQGGHRVVVDEAQAAVVRWIFEQAAEGRSVRSIVSDLNTRGVASPRGGTWAVSALQGNSLHGAGLLNNELYVGRMVWNRRQWLKDPDTGKRRYVVRPQEEWQVREQPELRIVSDDIWRAVATRMRPGAKPGVRTGRGASPRTLFAGLLRCPTCGGPWIAVNRTRYGCNAHKDRGPAVCPNGTTVLRAALDKRLVSDLREELLKPQAVAELHQVVGELVAERRRAASGSNATAAKRMQALGAEIQRLVDAIATVGLSGAVAARLKVAEEEYEVLQRQVSTSVPNEKALIDTLEARWRRMVMQLEAALKDEKDLQRTRQVLHELLGPVVVSRGEDGAMYAEFDEPAGRLLIATAGESLGVVAGACNVSRRRVRVHG